MNLFQTNGGGISLSACLCVLKSRKMGRKMVEKMKSYSIWLYKFQEGVLN